MVSSEIKEIKATVGDHSEQLTRIYAAIESLLAEKATQRSWEDREPIGFRPRPSDAA
jgi:hypothetical protein